VITVSGIRKRFGALDILQDVSLALRPGAVTAGSPSSRASIWFCRAAP